MFTYLFACHRFFQCSDCCCCLVCFLKSGGRNLYLEQGAWSSSWNSSQQLRHTTAGCWIINEEVVSGAFCGLPTSICLDGEINLGWLLSHSRLRKITYRNRRESDKRANTFCTPTHSPCSRPLIPNAYIYSLNWLLPHMHTPTLTYAAKGEGCQSIISSIEAFCPILSNWFPCCLLHLYPSIILPAKSIGRDIITRFITVRWFRDEHTAFANIPSSTILLTSLMAWGGE